MPPADFPPAALLASVPGCKLREHCLRAHCLRAHCVRACALCACVRSAGLAWLVLLALVLYTLEGPTGPRACKRLLSTANAAFAVQRQNGYSVLPTGGLGTAAALPYAYMYALYVCLICMPYMYALYSMPYTVSLICMPYMYALYVCLTCITICLICLLYMPCIVFLQVVLGLALLLSCVTSCVPAAPAVRSTVCQLWTMDLRGCVVCGVWCVVCCGSGRPLAH